MLLDFKQNYILENDRVLLRPLLQTDDVHLERFAINEPELWKYSLISAAGKEELKRYISKAIEARENNTDYPFIIFNKRTQTYAGSTRFYDVQLKHQTLQLGYTWIGKEHQGTGLNKNAKFLLLEFAFEKLDIERVEFRADNDNKKSIAAMQAIGCKIEGILRSNGLRTNGTRRDSIVLSILKEEWLGGLKQALLNQL